MAQWRVGLHFSVLIFACLAISKFMLVSFRLDAGIFSRQDALSRQASMQKNKTAITSAFPSRKQYRVLKDLQHLNVTEYFHKIVEDTLKPWLPFPTESDKLLRTDMFEVMEQKHYGIGFRVRIFRKRVYFRHIMRWKQPYFYSRLRFHLNIIRDAVVQGNIGNTEFFVAVGDGAKSAVDTSAAIHGLPVFNYITSDAHIDVLVPDPFEYGAYGYRYNFKQQPPDIPWETKHSVLYFRGGLTTFPAYGHNWNISPRIRAAKLSQLNSSLYDMHLTGFGHSDPQAVGRDTGLAKASKQGLSEQCHAKWNLNIDGGWGSCRLASILRCGSLCVQQESPWRTLSNTILDEGAHYIKVDRYLREVKQVVDWLQENDEEASRMAKQGKQLAERLLTREAAVEYWILLLRRWRTLFQTGQNFKPSDVEWDYCASNSSNLQDNIMNCSLGWMRFTSTKAFDKAYAGTPSVP